MPKKISDTEKKIKKSISTLTLTEEMEEKINKLREHRELEPIQFKDYIGTKEKG